MANKESSFMNMVVTLFLVTFIASAALGYIYEITKGPIALAQLKKKNDAIKHVLPDFERVGEVYKVKPDDEKDSLEFYPAYDKDSNLVGTAVKTFTNKGFSGYVSIMVGILPNGTINSYDVLDQKETPGLGNKMTFWFKDSVNTKHSIVNKNPESTNFHVSKDDGDIDAITAATISSRAFLDAVRRAYKTLPKEEGGKK